MIALLLGVLLAVPAASAARAVQSADTCECETQRPVNLAVVNGTAIPTSVVENDTANLTEQIRRGLDAVREERLQSLITKRLIEVEAAARGLSQPQLIQAEVVAKAGEPTDEDVRVFYERNRAGIPEPFEKMRESLKLYIRSQRQQVQMTILTTDLRSKAKIEVLEYSPKGPSSPADLSRILAVVNGSRITLGDLENEIREASWEARHQIYEIERVALDGRIDEILVNQEAGRRGMTPEALIAQEVTPKVRKVDAFDAAKFYNDNKEQFGGRALADVREDLLRILQNKAAFDARSVFAASLRPAAKIEIALVEPAPPTYQIDVAGRPAIGNATAPVTVIVFSDFECAKCAATHQMLEDVAKSYGEKVRLVVRHFPLEQHPNAHRAAQAAEAAFVQGKYWEYAKLLWENQKDLSPDRLKDLATQAGLDRTAFDAALASGKFAGPVDRDLSDGARIGVAGTPAVYVNGRPVSEDTSEGLRKAIDEALKSHG